MHRRDWFNADAAAAHLSISALSDNSIAHNVHTTGRLVAYRLQTLSLVKLHLYNVINGSVKFATGF